jgi:capsular polysaccharide transport system permease protein
MTALPPEIPVSAQSWVDRKQVVLRRASAVSLEIQEEARAIRSAQSVRTPKIWQPRWLGVAVRSTTRVPTVRAFRLTYLAVALIPSLASIAYFSVIASSQYVSEAKFAVHSGDRAPLDTLSSLIGAGSLQQVQNSMIVADYIKSRAIVEALEHRVGLRSMFDGDDVDWLSRFDPNGEVEKLTAYWRWKVKISIEMPSGIVSVEVAAFTPENSLRIARAVVSLSEELVNGMTRRSRSDQLEQSKAELDSAEKRMSEIEEAMRALRNSAGIIDPRKQAEGIGKLIEQLRLERIEMEQQVNVDRAALDPFAPQLKLLQSRAQALDVEIGKLQRMLTDSNPDNRATISNELVEFDRLELDRKSAVAQYLSASSAYERARADLETQKVYLDTFVTPVLAQESLYPHRFWFALLGVAASHLIWLFSLGAVDAIRRRLAQ